VSRDVDDAVVAINRISEGGPPGRFWPVVFVGGCNLRCPYCLNVSIADESRSPRPMPLSDALRVLDAWGEEGVMVSGGEPLSQPSCLDLIARLQSGGRKVGVSTNGTFPGVVGKALSLGLLSFVAVDCKFSPLTDDVDGDAKAAIVGGRCPETQGNMAETLWIIRAWHDKRSYAMSEVRTTLYPPLVDQASIEVIGRLVHPKSRWILQQYRRNSGFDGKVNPVEPYPEGKVDELLEVARRHCAAPVEVRWP
jgi:pyruvate formate lyase activating enzyme